MLVLRRRLKERVEITVPHPDGPVVVVVELVEIYRGSVRLGFTAPRDCSIMRSELTYKPNDPK